MSTPVKLPALGESVTEGTITRWLKQVGDTVEVDEPLLEVSTDKVDTEIPSPVAGKLLEIKAEEDETVEVGAELCIIGDEGEGGGGDSDDSEEPRTPADEERPTDAEEPEPRTRTTSRGATTPRPRTRSPTTPTTSSTRSRRGAEEQKPAAKKSSRRWRRHAGDAARSSASSVTEGTVTRWLKSVGDEVEVDEPLVEVSTDKVDTEIPSPSPARCWRSRSRRTRPSRSAPCWP